MSEIHFKQVHHLTVAQAKLVAQKAADDLGAEYDLVSEWEGDTLHFHRSGVEGHMQVTPKEIQLRVKLGFLLRPFKAKFEEHISKNLEHALAPAGATAKAPAAKKSTRKA